MATDGARLPGLGYRAVGPTITRRPIPRRTRAAGSGEGRQTGLVPSAAVEFNGSQVPSRYCSEAENAKLRVENKRLLDWITGESDALTCLQAIYQNSASSEHTRIKAASSAIAFERPKLSVAVSVRGSDILGQCLDDAKPMKVINPPETSD